MFGWLSLFGYMILGWKLFFFSFEATVLLRSSVQGCRWGGSCPSRSSSCVSAGRISSSLGYESPWWFLQGVCFLLLYLGTCLVSLFTWEAPPISSGKQFYIISLINPLPYTIFSLCYYSYWFNVGPSVFYPFNFLSCIFLFPLAF